MPLTEEERNNWTKEMDGISPTHIDELTNKTFLNITHIISELDNSTATYAFLGLLSTKLLTLLLQFIDKDQHDVFLKDLCSHLKVISKLLHKEKNVN